MMFDRGTEVGVLARDRFPGGLLIVEDYANLDAALRLTREAISSGADTVYDGAFLYDDVLVRADILTRDGDGGRHLVEVKSSTEVKETHLSDVAVQAYVLRGTGLDVRRCSIMHINNACTYPDLSDLFVLAEVTGEAAPYIEAVPAALERLKAAAGSPREPSVPIGSRCYTPYECPFVDRCWKDVPSPSTLDIPRLSADNRERIVGEKLFLYEDLPEAFPLPPGQRTYVERFKDGIPVIDREGIAEALSELAHPLAFLDFETDNPPVPRHPLLHPYGKFPFQFSLHIMDGNGGLKHREYLHADAGDPRPPLARALAAALPESGTVIAYNAGFEKSVLLALSDFVPEAAAALSSAAERLFDLLPVFRACYFHPGFNGSYSIKSVLPVLVPGLSYAELDAVHDGSEAQAAWNSFILLPEGEEKFRIARSLKDYCALDTLAMVELYRHLKALRS